MPPEICEKGSSHLKLFYLVGCFMRIFLERLYYFSAVLAGFCLAVMTLLILSQIVGRWFGVIIPSTEDFSGYLVASSFALGLAYSFRRGAIIRVTLMIGRFRGRRRFIIECFAMLIMVIMTVFIVWYFGYIVYESYGFQEVTQGYISIPLWIPQLPVFIGLLIFGIAVIDDVFSLLLSGQTSYMIQENTSFPENNE